MAPRPWRGGVCLTYLLVVKTILMGNPLEMRPFQSKIPKIPCQRYDSQRVGTGNWLNRTGKICKAWNRSVRKMCWTFFEELETKWERRLLTRWVSIEPSKAKLSSWPGRPGCTRAVAGFSIFSQSCQSSARYVVSELEAMAHLVRWFTSSKWWFSIVHNQRVSPRWSVHRNCQTTYASL